MGNITGILSNNFAHAQAVSSRPNCLGLEKEATTVSGIIIIIYILLWCTFHIINGYMHCQYNI